MFNSLTRLNNLSALISTTILILIGLITLTSLNFPTDNSTSIEILSTNVIKSRKYLEYAFVKFNLNVDTSHLFSNWNTKQVFLQLSAVYNDQHKTSKTVIWDKILHKPHYSIENSNQKYSWKSNKFSDLNNVTFELTYDIQPYVGLLHQGTLQSTDVIELPSAKNVI